MIIASYIKYKVSNFWYKVKCEIFPQHQELRKVVPKTWEDIDGIMEKFLDAAIVSFVEDENGLFDQIKDIEASENLTDEEYKKRWGGKDIFISYKEDRYDDFLRLRDVYYWVTRERAKYKKLSDEFLDSNNDEQYWYYEKYIFDHNTFYYKELIELRGYLWT